MTNVFGVIAALALAILLGESVFTDLRERRIPNRLVLIGLLLGFSIHLAAYFMGRVALAGSEVWSSLAGVLVGFLVLLPLYLLRSCGAGDVKLMAMVGGFVGPSTVAFAALYTLIAGALLAIVFMFGRGVASKTYNNVRYLLTTWLIRLRTGQVAQIEPLDSTAARLPYAVAISLGTIWALLPKLGVNF